MPAYRFYVLPRSGAEGPDELMFFSDEAAMIWGLRRAGAQGLEVWEGGRFVGRLHARIQASSVGPQNTLEDAPAL